MATFTPPEALDEEEAWSPPEAWEPPEALEQEPEQQSRLSSGLSEAARSFGKVFTGTAAGIPRLMDSPLTPSGLVNMGARAIMGTVSPEYKFALGMPKEQLDKINPDTWTLLHPNEALAQQIERLNPEIDKLLPTNPAYEGEWMAQKIPSVLGQATGQLTSLLVPGGIASKAAGVPAKAITPALQAIGLSQAGLLERNSGLEEAERLGVTSPVKKAIMGELFGAAGVGSEAMFGFGTRSFSKALSGEIRDLLSGSALKTFGKTAAGEGIEEGAAKLPQDIVSTTFRENEAPVDTIDPTKLDFWSNLGETMALGSIAGGLFGGVQALADRKTPTAALAMRTAVQEHTKSLEAKPDITPEEVGELEELRAYDQKLAEWLTQQGVDPAKQEEALMTASERFARADQNLTRLEEGVDKNRPSVPEQLQPIVEENLAAGNPKTAQALAGLTENLAIKREAEAAAGGMPGVPESPTADLTENGAAPAQTSPTAPTPAPTSPSVAPEPQGVSQPAPASEGIMPTQETTRTKGSRVTGKDGRRGEIVREDNGNLTVEWDDGTTSEIAEGDLASRSTEATTTTKNKVVISAVGHGFSVFYYDEDGQGRNIFQVAGRESTGGAEAAYQQAVEMAQKKAAEKGLAGYFDDSGKLVKTPQQTKAPAPTPATSPTPAPTPVESKSQPESQAVTPETLQPQPVVSDADAIQGPETLPLGQPPADSTTLRGPYPEGQEVTGEEIQGGAPATSGQVDAQAKAPSPMVVTTTMPGSFDTTTKSERANEDYAEVSGNVIKVSRTTTPDASGQLKPITFVTIQDGNGDKYSVRAPGHIGDDAIGAQATAGGRQLINDGKGSWYFSTLAGASKLNISRSVSTHSPSGQVDPFSPPPFPQQSPTPVANEVVSKFARMATLAKNPQLAEEYAKAGSVLAPLVGSVRNAFSNIYFRPRLNTAFAVMGDGSLLVDADHIAKGLSDGTWTPESLHVAMNEEITHLAVDNATARMLSKERGGEVTAEDVDAQHAKDWKMLPKRVRQESEWLYRLATIERARRAKGRELTEEEIEEAVRAVQSSDAIRGAEFKRQVMQGRIFGVLTEEAQRRPDFAKWLTDFLNELLQSIKDIAKRVTDPVMLRKLDELERDVRLELEAFKTGERAWTKGAETRTSPEPVSQSQDQAYLAAVSRGDMETAQRMVDEAAKSAGYKQKGFHGTDAPEFTVFNTEKGLRYGKTRDPNSFTGSHFAADEFVASKFSNELYGAKGGRVIAAHLRLQNPLQIGEGRVPEELQKTLDAQYEAANEAYNTHDRNKVRGFTPEQEKMIHEGRIDDVMESLRDPISEELHDKINQAVRARMLAREDHRPVTESELLERAGFNRDEVANKLSTLKGDAGRRYARTVGRAVRKWLLDNGYDGVFYRNAVEEERGIGQTGETFIVLHPSQIKSADPVTYDDQGKIIPLSQRFKAESRDIRFAPEPIGQQPLPDKPHIKKAIARAGKKKVREVWERLQENLRALEGESMRFDEASAEEKAGPTQATQDERTYAHSGEAVEFGRKSLTLDEIRSRTRQILNDAGWLNGGGLNPRLGQEVMKFLRGTSPLLGITNNPVIRFWMGKSILQDPSLRGQLRLDEREIGRVEKDLSTMLTQASRTMLGARGDFYNPMQEIGEEGRKDVDAESKKRGIDDIPEFTESILKEVEDKQKERVKNLTPEDKAVILDQAAMEAEDAGWFDNAMGAFDKGRKEMLERLKTILKRISEIRQRLSELKGAKSAAQPVGSEGGDTISELQQELDKLVTEASEILDSFFGRKKSKAKPNAERVEKEAKQIVEKAESEEGVAQATFTDWVNGQEQEGIDNFEDIVLENVNANGFNREAFSESLANKFEKVDPLFIEAVTNKIAEALDGKTEEQADSTPDYDGRAKKIVAKAVAQDAMPEPTEKQVDPLTALIKKRLKGEINETQFIAEATRLGIEEESAFALNRKVERDIQREDDRKKIAAAARQTKQEAEARKRENEKSSKEADRKIDQLAKEFSDTLSFDTKAAESEFRKLVREYSSSKDAMPDDQFHARTEALLIPREKSESLLGLLKEGRRRKHAVETAREVQKKAHERKLELEKNERETTAAWNALAKQLSDTPSFSSAQKSEVSSLIEKYKNKRIGERELEDGLRGLNVTQSTISGISAALQENRRRQDVVDKAKKTQKDEEDARLKNDRDAQAKLDSLSKDLSDTPSLTGKQKSEVTALIDRYKKGEVDTSELEDGLKKLSVNPATASSLSKALEENKRREAAVEYEREAERADKKIQSEIDRLAKDLSDTPSLSKKAASDLKKLIKAYKEFKIGEAELISGLKKLRVSQNMADKMASILSENRRRQVLENYITIRQRAEKDRLEAIESAVKKASKGKVPDLAKTNKFIKALEYALENGVMNADSVRDAFAESYDLHGLTTERLERLGRAIKKINELPDGQLKQTFLEDARKILNDIAPSSTVMSVAYQNLMSGVLSGASTMTAQFSGLSRILNPMQAAWSFLVQAGVNPLTSPKMLTKVWWDYARESMNAASMVAAGLEGSMGGRMKGLGVSPSRIQDFRPTGMDLGLLPWKDLGDARIGKSSIIRWMLGGTPSSEALRTLKKIALTPSWMARRSLNFIRSAEAWSGSVDKNMTFKAIAMSKLIKDGMNPNKAWNTVQDWMSPQTNKEMWDEAKAQADKELADGNISKHAVRQRVEELVQDKLDAEHKLEIKNRHREMSAHLNFKSEPLTKMGTWFSEKVMRNAPLPVKSVFLFSRFFANAIETAIFNSPLGFIHMSKERAAKGAQDEREKHIEAVFGSLEEYRQYRNGLATSSVVSSFAMSMAMALSWALWKWMDEDDEDKSPPFWITGSTPPSSPYATGRQLEAQGWWKPSTLFLRIPGTDSTLAINYVQANPQLAITLNAIGNTADRIMFPEMLTYKTDPRTGERTRSMFKTVVQPWMNALASPATRSTYVTTLQAFERAFDGNPQSLMKLLSRPVGDTLAASTIGGPISRDLAKMAKPEVPRASQSAAQAFASGIPFAHAMGADTGLPMLNQFGEEVSPFAYFPFFSAKQESSEPVKKAAKVLNDTGITKAGMEEWMMDSDLVELAANGERYLLSLDERREVLGEIGQRFADLINSNSDRIRSAKDDSHDKAKKIVQELQTRARKSVLNGWRDRIKKEQP